MFDIRLILSALRHHKVGVILVTIQIAMTFAIVCNVSSISASLFEKMSRPTGMNVNKNIAIESIGIDESFNPVNTIGEDLQLLRALPGVTGATTISEVPLGPSASVPIAQSITEKYGTMQSRGYLYFVDNNAIDALGLKLVAGRNFNSGEIHYLDRFDINPGEGVNPVIITRQWADKLYPDGDALGKKFETSYGWVTAVGIIDQMQGAWADWEGFERVMLFPGILTGQRLVYVVGTDGKNRDRLFAEIEETLYKANSGRVLSSIKGQEQFLNAQYKNHSALLTSLVIVGLILLSFAAFGIYALTKFNIGRQTRQIGIKRALGATKGYVVSYYLFENLLITVVGLLAGLLMVYGLNAYLIKNYSVVSLNWWYVPVIMVGYLIIGFIAVYFPANKAAGNSPVTAIRAS